MRAVVVALTILLCGAPALATQDEYFYCSFSDQNLKLGLRAYLGHDRTARIGGIDGGFEILAKNVPSNLRKLEFRDGDVVQQWLYRGDLKLMFSSGDVLLVIELQDPTGGRGSYKLTIEDTRTTRSIELHGPAKCR
jgi:hypothetical protein